MDAAAQSKALVTLVIAGVTLTSTGAGATPTILRTVPAASGACVTCHVSSAGGGPRNPFGRDVGRLEQWSRLFSLDSDGDGRTNGEELGDPNGTWRQGQATPTPISNPGVAEDLQSSSSDDDTVVPLDEAGGCQSSGPSTGAPLMALLFVGALAGRRRRLARLPARHRDRSRLG